MKMPIWLYRTILCCRNCWTWSSG